MIVEKVTKTILSREDFEIVLKIVERVAHLAIFVTRRLFSGECYHAFLRFLVTEKVMSILQSNLTEMVALRLSLDFVKEIA